MPIAFKEKQELVNALYGHVERSSIVGIDGWTGAGKTTLGRSIAEDLGGSSYDLDSALTRNLKNYVSSLRMSEISKALSEAPRPLVISGICLLEALAKVEIELDVSIYVKRMASWGWADEDELSGLALEIPGASGELLRREMRIYHQDWQPHLNADYEFWRMG
jgi:hypothetical protein